MNQCFLRRIPGRTLEARREGSFLIRVGALCLRNGRWCGRFCLAVHVLGVRGFFVAFFPGGSYTMGIISCLDSCALMARRV